MSPSSPPSSTPDAQPDAPPATQPAGRTPAHRVPLVRRSLESLDWPYLVAALVERAATHIGRERCAAIAMLSNVIEVRSELDQVDQMMALRTAGFAPPLGSIEDLRAALLGLQKGEVLEGQELMRIAHTLEGLERLQRHLADQADRAPRLARMASVIEPEPELASWLLGSFDSRGELSASAYPQLASLRSRKGQLHEQIRSRLDALRIEDRFTDALQDDFLAMRGDRYVVPVKSSQKRAGLGIVHDTSGSGQTVFVEPFEIIELNNELKMADAELRAEERRILRDLSERVAMITPALRRGLDAAGRLDFAHARALLGEDLQATVPEVADEPVLHLVQARHPVLVLRGLDVIPNDLDLGGDVRAMVLSGPNTGGKTIALKTLGLAALMVRAGLPIPADPGSVVGWFDSVLTDIGDLQDVEGDLSTFSGHVLCLVEMFATLQEQGGKALVLLDEIAVGTDPVQGAALGRAVLEALLDVGVLLATTTHYPELKGLSAADERFVNARVEFDAGEGRPTYRLSVGQPGSSHALDVAAQVGLPAPILAAARELLDPRAANVEGMLSKLESELQQARAARAAIEADRAEAERQRDAARSERDELNKRSRSLERDLRAEFEKEVRGYRAAVRGAMKQLKEEQSQQAGERARQRVNEGAAELRGRLGAPEPEASPDRLPASALVVGASVRVSSLGKEAVITVEPDRRGRVGVLVDGLRLQVKATDLETSRREASPGPKKGSGGGRKSKKQKRAMRANQPDHGGAGERSDGPEQAFRSPSTTLDLRGERVDEALSRVNRFLDDATMIGERYVFVLHGHGTGALKDAVRRHLRSVAYVKSQTPGTRNQGGDGVTVVGLDS